MAEEKNDKFLPLPGEGHALERREHLPAQPLEAYPGAPRRGAGPAEGESEGGGFSLRNILYVLFRHKWKIALTFLLVAVATFYVVAAMPKRFQSEARVLIRGDRTSLTVDPTGGDNAESLLRGDREGAHARTEIGILKSATLAERVVDKLGAEAILGMTAEAQAQQERQRTRLQQVTHEAMGYVKVGLDKLGLAGRKLTPRQMAIDQITGAVEAMPNMQESMVVVVTYQSHSPEMAQQVLDALIAAYLQQHIDVHKTQVSPEFFSGKIAHIKSELTAKENELDAERKRLKVSSLDNQKQLLLSQFNTFDTNLKESRAQINATKAKIQLMEQVGRAKSKSAKASGSRSEKRANPVAEQFQTRLIELKLIEADMTARFTPQSSQLRDIRRQIQEMEKLIANLRKSETYDTIYGGDSARDELEMQTQLAKAELQAEVAREATLIREVDRLRGELSLLLENEKKLAVLERDVQILDKEYRQYRNSLQIADISQALDKDKVANVSIVQEATLPTMAVTSQRKILALLGFGLFMGLALGLGWAFALEFMSHTVKTDEDVERYLGLPVLISLPYVAHHKPELQEVRA